MQINVNGRSQEVDVEPDMPLLWVLRDVMGLTGTKYGCGIAQCGSCTVHLDGEAVRSCSLPVSAVAGKRVVTIEGLSADSSHPVQKAWVALDVPQCGYCQSRPDHGRGGAARARTPKPTDKDIDDGDDQHLPLRHLPARARRDPHGGRDRPGRRVHHPHGGRH